MKPATKTTSWDTIATRNLRSAISRQDPVALSRALSERGNPNDQKRLNHWTAPETPLLMAVREGFDEGVAPLVNAGAKRRSSGSQSMSAFMCAVQSDQSEAFNALCESFGAMTGMEVLECAVAIRSFRGPSAASKQEMWVDRLIEAMEQKPVRLTPSTAAAIAMQFLGGESLPDPVLPHLLEKFIARGIITPALVARATDATGLEQWGQLLSARSRKPGDVVEDQAVEMLHALRFPFEAALRAEKGDPSAWLQAQAARWVAENIAAATPSSPVVPASKRPRL